jgi:hypothetical protein
MRITTHNVDVCPCAECGEWRKEMMLAKIVQNTAPRQRQRMTHWQRRKLPWRAG